MTDTKGEYSNISGYIVSAILAILIVGLLGAGIAFLIYAGVKSKENFCETKQKQERICAQNMVL